MKNHFVFLIGLWVMLFAEISVAHVKDEVWQVHKAAYPPSIDGEMDDIYKTASTERIVKMDKDNYAPPDSYLDLFANARLLWDEDYLYVLVKVADDEISSTSANSWENDSVEYFFDGDDSKCYQCLDGVDDVQIRIEYQDGSEVDSYDSAHEGTVGAVSDWENPAGNAFGYTVEAAFPMYALNIDPVEGTLIGFEIQINDRDNETRENMVRWWGDSNDAWHWAHIWGEAELTDYVSDDVMRIMKAPYTPEIDGVLDAVWIDTAPEIYQGTYVFSNAGIVDNEYTEISEWEDAQMAFRTMWDEEYFYFWCEVIDNEISITSSNSWENDSIELYFDGDNSKSPSYDYDDIQWRWVWYDYYYSYFINNIGIYSWGELSSGLNGYTFEIAIPQEDLRFTLEEETEIGFEVQVNDRDNEWRENMIRWWCNDNMSWTDPSLFGTAVLTNGGAVYNPVIALQTPNGGEIWQAGSQQTIRWTSNLVSTIKLEYSDDNGSSWHVIQSSISASNGSYTWTVPVISSNRCKVKITSSSDSSIFDVSNQVFEIRNTGLTLSNPNGGETFFSGSANDILWQSAGVGNVNIYISYNNGASWDVIASDQVSSGIWSWTVPFVSSMQALLKIEDADNPSIYDISDGPFIIKTGFVTGIDESAMPIEFSMDQNYPNPFNLSTRIKYGLPEPAFVNINIYNIEGKIICYLVQQMQEQGSYSVDWNGTDPFGRQVGSGLYICRMHAKGADKSFTAGRKMYLVK